MRKIWCLYLILLSIYCTAQVQQETIVDQSLSIVLQKIETEHKVIFSFRDKNITD